jgi:flagellar protein FlaJ
MLSYRGLATSIFGNLVDQYAYSFSIIRDNLPRADIRIAFRTYMSIVCFTSVIVFIVSLIATLAVTQFYIQVSLMMRIVYMIFIPMLAAMVSFVLIAFYPYQRASSRRKNIDTNLPFVLTHMGAIAESGIPPYVVFKLISRFKEYGEVSNEMGKIIRNIDTFGIDPLTAVKQVAEKSPSEGFKQVLFGFVTTTESGGDVRGFLKSAGKQALFDWRIKREKFLEQLSAYAEFYTGILIAAPLFIISLFAVMNMIQPSLAGFSITELMRMSVYLVIPMVNIAFLIFLRGVEVEM